MAKSNVKSKEPQLKTEEECWDEGYNDEIEEPEAYGHPMDGDVAAEQFGTQTGELPIYVIIHKDSEKKIKPRRGTPEVTADDFFKSLVEAPDGRWFFSGVLNGWGGLRLLQLGSLEKAKMDNKGNWPKKIKQFWLSPVSMSTGKQKKSSNFAFLRRRSIKKSDLNIPSFPTGEGNDFIRATLYLPKYSDSGYSRESPGPCWYFAGSDSNSENHRFAHGSNMISATEHHERKKHGGKLPKATFVHHFGHRYAKVKESRYDRMVYHTGLFVEWDHQEYGTIIELAWKNGIGGYKGQSNWVEDKVDKPSSNLYKLMPAACKLPWQQTRSEVRFLDVPIKNLAEFKAFLNKYSGPTERFLDAKVKYSDPVLVKNRTKPDLVRYALNRMSVNTEYSEPVLTKKKAGYNCQTFAATFFGFLTNQSGKLFSIPVQITTRQAWFRQSFVDGKPIPIEYERRSRTSKKNKDAKMNAKSAKNELTG